MSTSSDDSDSTVRFPSNHISSYSRDRLLYCIDRMQRDNPYLELHYAPSLLRAASHNELQAFYSSLRAVLRIRTPPSATAQTIIVPPSLLFLPLLLIFPWQSRLQSPFPTLPQLSPTLLQTQTQGLISGVTTIWPYTLFFSLLVAPHVTSLAPDAPSPSQPEFRRSIPSQSSPSGFTFHSLAPGRPTQASVSSSPLVLGTTTSCSSNGSTLPTFPT